MRVLPKYLNRGSPASSSNLCWQFCWYDQHPRRYADMHDWAHLDFRMIRRDTVSHQAVWRRQPLVHVHLQRSPHIALGWQDLQQSRR